MIALSININKVALIRNSRPGNNPDLVNYAKKCVRYGAKGITVHPRPDQRHIRAQDCINLANANLGVEFNIEGNPFASYCASDDESVSDYPGFMAIIRQVKPDQCTLVPDSHQQKTSDHGFDLTQDTTELAKLITEIKNLGCRVSLFMDADLNQIPLAKAIGADRIELYTGPFAEDPEGTFNTYKAAALLAHEIGLGINAGHDLNLENMALMAQLPSLEEVSIGHALTLEAMDFGLEETINRYIHILEKD
ncbi:MAG: pyridoxine 5'-phosphate synthase [Cellvibrionales bacterium]|nr:pyridoxine 5'-phosphate synthase [Cellvibrionales bacterium]